MATDKWEANTPAPCHGLIAVVLAHSTALSSRHKESQEETSLRESCVLTGQDTHNKSVHTALPATARHLLTQTEQNSTRE